MTSASDKKLIIKIEKIMKTKHADKKHNSFGFVFPNGSISSITIDHCATAKAVAKFLKMNCHNIDPMYYFLSLGVIRIRNNGTLIVEGTTQPSKTTEKTILDFAAGHVYDTVFIDFGPQYYRQAEFLKKKLENGMVGRFD